MKHHCSSRLLLVEGYIGNAKALSSHLEGVSVPLDIEPIQEGEAALDLLGKEPFDLLLIDACLKGRMDGYELCRTIKSSPTLGQIPVIMLLGGNLILERSKGMSAGADLLIQRPVLKEELCKMVQLLLEWKLIGPAKMAPDIEEARPLRHLRPVG